VLDFPFDEDLALARDLVLTLANEIELEVEVEVGVEVEGGTKGAIDGITEEESIILLIVEELRLESIPGFVELNPLLIEAYWYWCSCSCCCSCSPSLFDDLLVNPVPIMDASINDSLISWSWLHNEEEEEEEEDEDDGEDEEEEEEDDDNDDELLDVDESCSFAVLEIMTVDWPSSLTFIGVLSPELFGTLDELEDDNDNDDDDDTDDERSTLLLVLI
jgi:hypothetical protein